MHKPDPVPMQMKQVLPRGSQDDNIPMVTGQRCKLCLLRLPTDFNGESDNAQADEDPLAG
jgi:hypothetical protein